MQIHTIDLKFRGLPNCIAAFLIESQGELALIETGPTSTHENLLAGIRAAGFEPGQVRKVLVTHIHLDHAGAAGWWANQGAKVFVHPRGARHLVDPEKLAAGAAMVYGDALDSLWGEIMPAPAENVTALEDGETVSVGGVTFSALDTPGHARHHHAFLADGVAFTGDVAGARLPGASYIDPTTAPSQFDPAAYLESIAKLRERKLDRLFLTHFGEITDVDAHLERYAEIIQGVAELIRAHMRNGADRDQLVEALANYNLARAHREGVNWDLWQRYETANDTGMCADGIAQFWEKQIEAAS